MGSRLDPIQRFIELLERARTREVGDATAMTLATADGEGRPAARQVLLKGVDERGFVFFTNYESRKALELAENPRAALCFHWESIRVQVRVEGTVQRLEPAESDAYFAGRPRASQIAAWASRQSRPLRSRATLLSRWARLQARYAGREVPRPPFWGGFRVVPDQVEFWFNQPYRLHDRELFTRSGERWTRQRLYP